MPNAFGLNDIGERLGLGKNWPNQGATHQGPTSQAAASQAATSAARPSSVPPVGVPPTWSQGQPYTPQAAPYTAPPYAPPSATGANWAGYVSPDAFAQAPSAAYPFSGAAFSGATVSDTTVPSSEVPLPAGAPSWNSVPFTATQSGPPGGIASPGIPAALPERRFPVGAVLLIGLGGIFLLSNVAPAWHLSERWLLPLLLAAAAVWTLVRRLGLPSNSATPALRGGALVCALRLPCVLLVLAIMFLLQAAGWLTIGQSWPLLLIVLGALLLLERTLGRVPPSIVASPIASGTVPSSADLAEGGTR